MKRVLLFLLVVSTQLLHAQTTVQFTSTSDNGWLVGSNWAGGSVPGSSVIGVFNTQPAGNGSNNGCNIIFNDPSTNNGVSGQILGAIRVLATRTADMNIGNSSPSIDGTLTLNGVTVGTTANVVVDNLMPSYTFHINNSIVGNNRIMKLALPATAVFNGAANSTTEITTQVISATNVTVNGGTLQLNRTGGTTFPTTTNFTVSSGSLRISADQAINNLDLAAGTTLYVDASTTLTINGTLTNRGGTIVKSGSGQLVYGTGGTLDYNGTSAQTVSTGEWPTTGGPKNITISNPSGVTLTADRTLTGTLTVNGVFSAATYLVSANAVTVNSGATLKVASTSTSGALVGNFGSSAVTLNTGSTVEYNGTGLQYASARTFSNLTLNNGGNGLSLAGNVTVSGVLTASAASKIDLAGKIMTLGGTVSGTITYKGSSASGLSIASSASVGTLNFDQTTDGSTNALASLAVSSGSATLGGKLNVYSGLNVSGGTLDLAAKNLVLKSNSAQTAYVAAITGTLTGETNVTVERYSPAWSTRRYRLMTSPVTGASINAAWQEGNRWNGSSTNAASGFGTLITGQTQGNATTANNNGFDFWSAIANASASVRTYVGATSSSAASWQPVTSTLTANAFDNHQAYLVYIRGDRSFSSGTNAGATTLRPNGTMKKGSFTVSVPITQSHTVIGNPYPSPLDFKAIYDANTTKIQPSFYIWQSSLGTGTGGFVLVRPVSTGSSLYETVPGDGSQTTANRLIHSGEGFIVMPSATATTGNSITIQESHKSTTTPSVSVFRHITSPSARLYVNLYAATDSTKVLLDGALSQYNNFFSGNDTILTVGDGSIQKAFNSSENISIQREGKDWIVTSGTLPQKNDTLKLRTWNTVAKTYKLEVKTIDMVLPGLTPILVDKYLNKTTVISTVNPVTSYSFSVSADVASKDPSRFYIVFKETTTLPLSITSLRAEEKNKGVNLKWFVADESGINTYEIEKATDGTTFSNLATVKAKAGAGAQAYEFLDVHPSAANFYRIRMIGTASEVKYSSVVSIQLKRSAEGLSVYPNPVTGGTINLQFSNKSKGLYTIGLYNLAGQLLTSKIMQHEGGNATEAINLSAGLPRGNYKLVVEDAMGGSSTLDVNVLK